MRRRTFATLAVLIGLHAGLSTAANATVGVRDPSGLLPDEQCFFDDVESGEQGWTADCGWQRTTETSHSPESCWTDSPGTLYSANQDCSLRRAVTLSGCARPYLAFWHRYSMETDADAGFVEVSQDGGSSWTRLYGVTGFTIAFESERVDLSAYAGQTIELRFRILTNGSNNQDGWYVDDVGIFSNLAENTLPFADDMEGPDTITNWIPGAWAFAETEWSSPTHSWTDSPAGAMFYATRNSLTLAGKFDFSNLAEVVNPSLQFWQRTVSLWSGDVEISTDAGLSWAVLYSAPANTDWQRRQLDLSTYLGAQDVMLRFRAYRGTTGFRNGWWIDDVVVSNAPLPSALQLQGVSDHAVELCWTASNAADFAQYELRRSENASQVGEIIATLTDPSQTCYTDAGLPKVLHRYHYRLYVRDTEDLLSQSSNQVTATTACGAAQNTVPFFDDMESGSANWCHDTPWQITQEIAHSPTHSWSDSPGSLYGANVGSGLYMKLVVSGVTRPVLSFWHRHSFETDADFGYVEVSADAGASWTRLYGVTGPATSFQRARIDLSQYIESQLLIRFLVTSNAAGGQDGWHIDDVRVDENTSRFGLPFRDDMEGSATVDNWISAAWQRAETDWSSPTHSWTDSLQGAMYYATSNHLTLAGTFDFSDLEQVANPQISFWERSVSLWSGSLDVSTDSGRTWTSVYSAPTNTDWRRRQLDLSSFLGASNVVLRFRAYRGTTGFRNGWWIDDVVVSNAPLPVTLQMEAVADHQAELCWTRSGAVDYSQYELYRSENASQTGEHIATFRDQERLCYTDTELPRVLHDYHYRVFVRDSENLLSQSSNQVTARTTCGAALSIVPFADDVESGGAAWCHDSPWGITEEAARSATQSWSDSPGRVYADDTTASLYMKLVVSGVTRPLLTFWHRYSFEANADFGWVDVSADGGAGWTRLYAITGSTAGFERVRLDLSEYVESQLLIRFRLTSNGAVGQDGWHIDDVSVIENSARTAYPFCDDAEQPQTTANWIAAGWELVEDEWGVSPLHSWTDSPDGPMDYATHNRITLRGSLDFSDLGRVQNPELRFWQRAVSLWSGTVAISTDGGGSWTTLYSAPTNTGWQQMQIPLATYLGASNVLLRFEAYRGTTGFRDGWWIDDIEIAEAGAVCEPLTPCGTKGDSDCDERACLLFDVLESIDQVLGRIAHTCEADVDCSGVTDIFDVLCTIDCALGRPGHCLIDPCDGGGLASGCSGEAPTVRTRPSSTPTALRVDEPSPNGLRESRVTLALDLVDATLRGLSLVADVPPRWSVVGVEASGLQPVIEPSFHQEGSTLRVILVSPEGASFRTGARPVLHLILEDRQPEFGFEHPRIRVLETQAVGDSGPPARSRSGAEPRRELSN